jgi:pimeloyl-ACP methyl ester carboxylesterase
MNDVREGRLVRPDGRTVAWSESGLREGRPVLRLPGTPGSRLSLRMDQAPWVVRELRVITVERPGFGVSTRLPGRGFAEHADDLAAILDHLGVGSLAVYGGSGGAPHVLGFAARHPARVLACSIVDGAAPLTDDEVGQQVDIVAAADRLARAGEAVALRALLDEARTSILADPIAGYREVMETAPAADQQIMADPAWQAAFTRGICEALAPGVDGWLDEVLAMGGYWPDFDVGAVTSSVTWWHGDGDRNCPLSAAQRLVGRLPNAQLIVSAGSGHLVADGGEGEILDELLERAGSAVAVG